MLMTQIKSTLRSVLRCDFLRREDGSIAIEAVIVMPLLFWTYLSMFSIFDAFRMYSINQKAAYTIGDAISRETVPIDGAYLEGAQDLFEYLSRSQDQTSIRVSSIYYDAGQDEYRRDWSQKRGSVAELTNADVKNWHEKLPVLPDNERLVLVETWADYDPPFNTGLEEREIRNFVFTRPRYAPRVCWETCN
ncbi:MAG: TadE/TadG family type IV pilus assembly protein [Sulfitobacter sp.]